MNKLTELGIKHNTDKATGHGFTDFYFSFFEKYKNPIILEIGVYDGASLKMMDEFYGSAKIVGIDIESKTQFDSVNVKTIIADQSKPVELLTCLNYYNEYDIIIDDGGHTMDQQQISIAHLFKHVKSGGIYVMEDLHTSFIGPQFNRYNDTLTTYDLMYKLSKGLEFSSPYINEEQSDYLLNNVESVSFFQKDPNDFLHSITSVIVKK